MWSSAFRLPQTEPIIGALAPLATAPPPARAVARTTHAAQAGAVIVESIRSDFATALADVRRRRAIERLDGHYVSCGYARAGRRAYLAARRDPDQLVVHPAVAR